MNLPRSSLPQLVAAVTTLAVAWLVTPLPVFAQNYQTIDPLSGNSEYINGYLYNNKAGQIVGTVRDTNCRRWSR